MKLGSRALALFAVVGLVPVGLVVPLLISVNQRAVETTEQQLQAAVIDELKNVTLRHVDGVRDDATAVAFALHDAANAPEPPAGSDGLEVVRAILGSRRNVDAVRFEVPERNVSTVIRRQDASSAADVSVSTPELRKIADERGVAIANVGNTRGMVVVPIVSAKGGEKAAGSAKGYVTAALVLDDLNGQLQDIAERRFGGAVGLAVVDTNRRPVAAFNMPDLVQLSDPATHPIWAGFSKENTSSIGVGRVAPYIRADGVEMISAVEWLAGLGWGVVTVRREADAYGVLISMRTRGLYVAAFAAFLALAAGAFAARSVSKPIVQLADQARRIGERKWQQLSLTTGRSDEIGDLTRGLSSMATELQDSEALIARQAQQRADLGRFLSKDLVDAIISGRHELSLGGRRAPVTVLFADVVAFTPLAESKPAEEIVALLNELFSVLTEVVFRHGGTVDKFLGDCIMAVWGAPVAQEDHASRALAAAEDMMRFLEATNDSFRERYGVTIELGIGINSGDVLVGNIGSDQRMEYTVIGDVVNVAARLEGIARPNQVLLGESTHALVDEAAFEISLLGERSLTGRKNTTKVYELVTS